MVTQAVSSTRADEIWRDPAHLPHAIDAAGRIVFVSADIRKAQALPFLDGRERFWSTEGAALPPSDFATLTARAGERRALLHMAFAGSTMAARMLDVPGKTFAWRELAIEIALADALANGRATSAMQVAIDALLARQVAGAVPFSKPSNWANVLAPQWAATGARLVLMTMAPRPYLSAVFRGGRERMTYVLRSATHFSRVSPGSEALLAEAAASGGVNSLLPVARLALLALSLQYRLFSQTGQVLAIDADQFRADPAGQSLAMAEALVLPLDRADIAARFAHLSGRHAKSDRAYEPEAELAAIREIEQHHGAVFDRALEWARCRQLRFDLAPPA